MAGRAQEGVVGVMNLAVVTHFELKMQEYASGIHAIFHELPLAGGQSSGDFLVGLLETFEAEFSEFLQGPDEGKTAEQLYLPLFEAGFEARDPAIIKLLHILSVNRSPFLASLSARHHAQLEQSDYARYVAAFHAFTPDSSALLEVCRAFVQGDHSGVVLSFDTDPARGASRAFDNGDVVATRSTIEERLHMMQHLIFDQADLSLVVKMRLVLKMFCFAAHEIRMREGDMASYVHTLFDVWLQQDVLAHDRIAARRGAQGLGLRMHCLFEALQGLYTNESAGVMTAQQQQEYREGASELYHLLSASDVFETLRQEMPAYLREILPEEKEYVSADDFLAALSERCSPIDLAKTIHAALAHRIAFRVEAPQDADQAVDPRVALLGGKQTGYLNDLSRLMSTCLEGSQKLYMEFIQGKSGVPAAHHDDYALIAAYDKKEYQAEFIKTPEFIELQTFLRSVLNTAKKPSKGDVLVEHHVAYLAIRHATDLERLMFAADFQAFLNSPRFLVRGLLGPVGKVTSRHLIHRVECLPMTSSNKLECVKEQYPYPLEPDVDAIPVEHLRGRLILWRHDMYYARMQQQEALRHLNSLEFHMAGPSEDPVIKRFQRVQVNEMSISETTYLFLQVLAHSMELLKRKFRSVSGPEAAQIRDMAGDFVTMFKDGTIKPLVTKEAFKALLSLVLSIAGGAMDAHSIREVMTVFHSKVHMVGPEFAEQLREAISKVTDIVDLARTATESAGAEGQVKDELHHHDGAQASVEKEKPLSEEVFYSILMMLISAPAARVASARGTSADASTPVASASAHATATVFHRADDDTPSADSDPSSSR